MSMGRVLTCHSLRSRSALTFAGSAGSATTAPSLRLVSGAPLILRGTGFQARERVRVTLTTRAQARRTTLTAGAAGGFTYRAGLLVVVDPCRGTIVVNALGLTSGLRAAWKRVLPPTGRVAVVLLARRAA